MVIQFLIQPPRLELLIKLNSLQMVWKSLDFWLWILLSQRRSSMTTWTFLTLSAHFFLNTLKIVLSKAKAALSSKITLRSLLYLKIKLLLTFYRRITVLNFCRNNYHNATQLVRAHPKSLKILKESLPFHKNGKWELIIRVTWLKNRLILLKNGLLEVITFIQEILQSQF